MRIALLFCLAAACASAPRPAYETGTLKPGGTMKVEVQDDEGPDWSLRIEPDALRITFAGKERVLEGYGSRNGLRYELWETEPPRYVFHPAGRPQVYWHGETIRIGEKP